MGEPRFSWQRRASPVDEALIAGDWRIRALEFTSPIGPTTVKIHHRRSTELARPLSHTTPSDDLVDRLRARKEAKNAAVGLYQSPR